MPHGEISVRLSLRWRDMDTLGHLNQSVYHELLEEGRAGLLMAMAGKGAWVLARVELDHRHEVRKEDEAIDVVVAVDRVGTKSLTLVNEIRLLDGTVCAAGKTVLVAWDPDARGARELTAHERQTLQAG